MQTFCNTYLFYGTFAKYVLQYLCCISNFTKNATNSSVTIIVILHNFVKLYLLSKALTNKYSVPINISLSSLRVFYSYYCLEVNIIITKT